MTVDKSGIDWHIMRVSALAIKGLLCKGIGRLDQRTYQTDCSSIQICTPNHFPLQDFVWATFSAASTRISSTTISRQDELTAKRARINRTLYLLSQSKHPTFAPAYSNCLYCLSALQVLGKSIAKSEEANTISKTPFCLVLNANIHTFNS